MAEGRVEGYFLALAFSLCLCVSSAAGGFPSPPEIAGLLPCGGQRGTTAIIRVQGKNLQGAQAFVSGAGIRVAGIEATAGGEQATVRLMIAPDAPLGPRELRIGTPGGVSNPAHLWVDVLPGILETEPNDTLEKAQKLERTPIVVSGQIQNPTDEDVFTFEAQAGETWVFDCNAARLRSRLDPILELRDARGHTLQMAQSAWESDPCLIYRFAVAGRYFLTLRDTQFSGGLDFCYRLTIGMLPVVTGFLPRGGQPGQTTRLRLAGVNLDTTTQYDIAVPSDMPSGTLWIAPATARGLALPIPFLVEAAPVVQSGSIAHFPVNIDGTLLSAPQSSYRFVGEAQKSLVFDLLARRIGSRIDGDLRILDTAGKLLVENDDAIGKDARLEFTPPKAGEFVVEVRNVEEKTGGDCFYRLEIQPATPDFALRLDVDRLQVGAGGTVAFPIRVERQHGFDGSITLMAEDLPSGVTCTGGILAAGQNSIEITLTAKPDAALLPTSIHLRGTANLAGKTVTRDVLPREAYMPRWIDPGMFQDDSYRRPYRVCDILPLGVVARTEPFALETSSTVLKLAPGQTMNLTVRALRRPEAKGEIKLELRGLPEKVAATTPSIAANASEARITLTVAPDAPLTTRNLIIQGKLDQAVQPAPAITLTIQR